MKRMTVVACGAVVFASVAIAAGVTPQALYESKPVTATATIEAINKEARTVTLKLASGRSEEVKAPDEMQGFNNLRVGDQVSATYLEAIVVRVSKPGDPPPPEKPTTIVGRKDRAPGSDTRRDQTFRVTITAIDTAAPSLGVKGPRGMATLKVTDPAQLKSLKVGDTVDVTYHESLFIKVDRAPKKD